MRLLLYNIRYAAGIGRQFHFPFPYSGYVKNTNKTFGLITQFIRSVHPDIVGLIEVDAGSFRSENANQAAMLAKQLEYTHVFRNKYAADSLVSRLPVLSKQGNAVLSKQRILDWEFHYLNNGVKRLVIEVEFKDLNLFLVHLSLKYRHRQHQMAELADLVRRSHKPVVVAGDFNAFRGGSELEGFLAETGLKDANGNGYPSHPSRSPRRQLDFILHSPDLRPSGLHTPRITLSDHVPMVWDFHVR